mmetsp:Transcript_111154/g.346422  ORF Transcript_111154/g.346422 Transcript_111154/m.346422 type:complete len:310 (+) Transcript_111154:62-991(+)
MERDRCSHSSHRSCICESPSKLCACISLISCSNVRTLSASRNRFCCSACSSSRAFRSWRSACWCMVSRKSILCCCCCTCCRRLCTSSPALWPSPQTLSSPPRVAAEATLCIPGAPYSEATLEPSGGTRIREGEDAAVGTGCSAFGASGCCATPAVPRQAPPEPSAAGAATKRAPAPPPPPPPGPGPPPPELATARRRLPWVAWEPPPWEPPPELALEGRSGSGGRVRGGVAFRDGTGLTPGSLLGLWQRAGLVARPMARCAEERMSSSSCSQRRCLTFAGTGPRQSSSSCSSRRSLASSSLRRRSSFSW